MTDNNRNWRMRGKYLKNCSCDPGCPCDFWADPTHHHCKGTIAMEIDEGHFNDVKLDGLKFAVTFHWPGPLHEGNGTIQPIIDESASEEQRNSLLQILSGQVGGPWFEVVASITSTVLEPQFAPIDCQFDIEEKTAHVSVPGILETSTEPIQNLSTNSDLDIKVQMPKGMEYRLAEIAKAVVNIGTGDIKYDCPDSHSSLAYVDHTPGGLAS